MLLDAGDVLIDCPMERTMKRYIKAIWLEMMQSNMNERWN